MMRINLLVFTYLLWLTSTTYSLGPLFADKPNSDLYWKALIYMAHNDKETALKIIEAIKNNQPLTVADLETPGSLNDFFDQLFVLQASYHPEMLTDLRLFESIGIREHNAHLSSMSPQSIQKEFEETKACLVQLRNYSHDQLSQEQKTSYQIVEWMLDHEVAGEPFLFHGYVVNQMTGILFNLPSLFMIFHPLEVEEDVHTYIARLEKVPTKIAQVLEILELQKHKDIVPPHFTIEKVINIIQKLTPTPVAQNVFFSHLEQRLNTLEIPDKEAVLKKAASVIEEKIYPSFQQLDAFFHLLLSSDQPNNGVWALPQGDDYYNYKLKLHTTTNLTAQEIHEIGLAEVTHIEQQMRAIFADEGIVDNTKSIGQLMQELAQDRSFYYPNTDEGRKQCLEDYKAIIERTRIELAPLFDLKPAIGVNVEAVPAHAQEGAPAAYYHDPSLDDSRPGIFFANLRNMDEIPKYGMETLAVHEAEPGHHFQLALQQKMDMPMIRKISGYTAYIEGWALYAEKLAYEHNFYSSSFSKLGHFRDEMLRAVRLVVDTGIHYKRWTREQAIEYMQKYTGFHYDSIVTEVERYFVMPGQACAYKIGQLKILELRKRAQDALGDAFDIRQFHNVVLKLGAVPLTILEQEIDRYINNPRIKF